MNTKAIVSVFLAVVITYYFKCTAPRVLVYYFQDDMQVCRTCYKPQVIKCQQIYQNVKDDDSKLLVNILGNIFPKHRKRRIHWLTAKNDSSVKLLAKEFGQNHPREDIKRHQNYRIIKEKFIKKQNFKGFQYCPVERIDRFVGQFSNTYDKLTIWLYIAVNIQPLLLPVLEKLQFPVPETQGVCGFTVFQSHAGETLGSFHGADYETKLLIAKKLLEGVLKFSEGFDGFRIYFTDLKADNLAYDPKTEKLTFIDLDTIFIVDSTKTAIKPSVHCLEYMECPDCFAFSPQDLCTHHLSDINLFQACQFLREDLNRDMDKGFLTPVPGHVQYAFPQFRDLLYQCVECQPPQHRFPLVHELIHLIDQMLTEKF